MTFVPPGLRAGLAAAALCASGAATSAQAYDFPCFDEATYPSARIHDLRVMLMVSALKCRFDNPHTMQQYSRLLDQRADEFAHHGRQVRADLVARHGEARGEAEFDSYNTRLSNYHSRTRLTRELCDDSAAFMRLAGRASETQLATLSKLATNRAVRVCPAPAAMRPRAEPRTMAGDAGLYPEPPAGWTEGPVEMVDGVPTHTRPGSAPDTRPEPLETVDVPAQADRSRIASAENAASEAAEAAASGDDARIDQAIAALSAAAEALRELKTAP